MSDCRDHGSDEAPWMCECTAQTLAEAQSRVDELRAHAEAMGRMGDAMAAFIEWATERNNDAYKWREWRKLHADFKAAQPQPEEQESE